jgi:hypothetical protein
MALKACRECGKDVSTSARRCPQCGITYPVRGPLKEFVRLFVVGFPLAVLLLIVLANVMFSGDSDSPHPRPATTSANQGYAFGDQVAISAGQGFGAWIAQDAAWDSMLDAQNSNNVEAIRGLMRDGVVVFAVTGTRAMVTSTGVGRVKLRFESDPGPFEGWVQREFVGKP